jgi:hypothetical protein
MNPAGRACQPRRSKKCRLVLLDFIAPEQCPAPGAAPARRGESGMLEFEAIAQGPGAVETHAGRCAAAARTPPR